MRGPSTAWPMFALWSSLAVLASNALAANINNCSGHAPPSPPTYSPYFASYGPQAAIGVGWDMWTFHSPVIGDDFGALTLFRWTRGDPANPSHGSGSANLGTFSASVISTEHGNFIESIIDEFVYHQPDNSHFSICVGDNCLSFDGSLGTFNGGGWKISVDISGFSSELFIDPVSPHVPFAPSYNGVTSQLVDDYFINMPIHRGHLDGMITYPSGAEIPIKTVCGLQHAYARDAIQDLLSSYTRSTVFVGYQQLNWIRAQGVESAEMTDAAQLVTSDLYAINHLSIKYQVTNEPVVLTILSSGLDYTVSLSGCSQSEHNPWEFVSTLIDLRGSLADSAGGRFDYYSIGVSARIWTEDDQLYVGSNSTGVLEVYTPPSTST